MPDTPVTHHTFVINRSYSASPERVFAALADPAKKRRWFAEGNHHDVEKFEMDFRVGGQEHFSYRFKQGTPFPGTALASDGVYHDIVPNQRVVIGAVMTLGDKRISAALATFELVPAGKGTDLVFTHQAAFFEGADGPKMREAGWRALFDSLEKELTR